MVEETFLINEKKDIERIVNNIFIKDFNKTIGDLGYLDIQESPNKDIELNISFPSHSLYSYQSLVHDIEKKLRIYNSKIKFNININVNVLPMSRYGIIKKKNVFNIKNIILVASGKGGVGKSVISSSIAFNLGRAGSKVGLLDADIYGPSVPTIWNIDPSLEKISGTETNKLLPFEKYNVKLMSIGFFSNKNDAMILRGPMITSAINQMVTDVVWGELDYLIVDLPPGTGDIQISLMQKFPISASIIVTTMQNIAFADVLRAKNMLEKMNIPIIGCIANMSYFECYSCETKHKIFSTSEGENLLKSLNIEILGFIPLSTSIGHSLDIGKISNLSENNDLNNKIQSITFTIVAKIAKEAEKTKSILYNQLPII